MLVRRQPNALPQRSALSLELNHAIVHCLSVVPESAVCLCGESSDAEGRTDEVVTLGGGAGSITSPG